MLGKIIDFSEQRLAGAITGSDSKRYLFTMEDWKSEDFEPERGMTVDFVPLDGNASEIYVSLTENTPRQKNRITAGILAILLGGVGAHKFYLGKIWLGILYTVVAIGFCWLIIPPIVIGTISLVEGIIYLTKSDKEFSNQYAKKV